MRVAMLALVTAVLLGTAPAYAGHGEKGDWELGVYGGYGWLDDYGPIKPDEDMLYGARLGYFFSRHWSFEISAQRLPTERDTVGSPLEVELNSFRGNLLYTFAPDGPVRPFLTAGIGRETVDPEGFDDSTDMGWNLGGGLRWSLGGPFSLRTEARWVSVNVDDLDESMVNTEALVGLSLLFGGDSDVDEGPPPTAAPTNNPPTVSCAPERTEILPGETVRVNVTASDPDGDPLTYAWTTSSGRVMGTGATATLDFTGVTGPSTANVQVRVSDGRGGIVTCDLTVNQLEATKPAESASCLAGGFPRGLSRLNNVDKACLDDYVTRLQADPRAKVVVIGHADTGEANRVAQARADAVKSYLVSAGVEASRVTVRSSGSSRPLDTTDAARNRRVEVWFVPEGAVEPQ